MAGSMRVPYFSGEIEVGCPVNKDPSQWLRLSSTLNVIESMSNNMGKSHIMKSKRDKGGGTEDFPIHRLQNIIL